MFNLGGVLRNIGNQIGINGHTDPVLPTGGAYASNWELSMARAAAVANALRRSGYAEDIIAFGFADSRFSQLPDLPTDQRHALGRRVDIVVLPNAGGVVDYVDTQASEVFGRPDAGEHQQLGRSNCAAADHDLVSLHREYFAATFGLYPHRAFALEQDAPGGHAAPDVEIQPVAGHVQVIQGIAHAHAINGVSGPG